MDSRRTRSTLSSTVGTIGSNFTVDVFQRLIRPQASAVTMLWVSRVSILITGAIAAAIYYAFPLLLELFFAGARLTAGALAPALIAVLLIPEMRRRPRTILAAK